MDSTMTITSAKYIQFSSVNITVQATIDGQDMSVPMDPDNRHYAEILRQVADGTITIEDAD